LTDGDEPIIIMGKKKCNLKEFIDEHALKEFEKFDQKFIVE